MKPRLRFLLVVTTLLALSIPCARATVLIELAGGYLKDAGGTAVTPGAGLLLLVASAGDADFSSITSASDFTVGSLLNAGTDDYVLFSSSISGDGYMDDASEGGEFRQVITLSLASPIAEGAALALVWLPTLSASSTSAAAGTAYGFYRSSVSSGSTDADGSDAWFLPADGVSGWSLLFLTSDAGSQVNTSASGTALGLAASSVAAVPEPSTWGCVILGLAAAVALGKRARRA